MKWSKASWSKDSEQR